MAAIKTVPKMRNYRYIKLIKHILLGDERVEFIARQSRIWPGVPFNSIAKPKVIFVTNKRLIIVSRPLFGIMHGYNTFPWGLITRITLEHGILFYTIVIAHMGSATPSALVEGERRELTGIWARDALALQRAVETKLEALEKTPAVQPKRRNGVKDRKGATISCLNCNTPNEVTFNYCYKCGAKLLP